MITSNQQLKNNLTRKNINEQRNCQDLLLLPKLSFDLNKSNFMPDTLIEYLEKLNKRINENILKIGKNDLEIPKGNFYFPLQNNFRVNLLKKINLYFNLIIRNSIIIGMNNFILILN